MFIRKIALALLFVAGLACGATSPDGTRVGPPSTLTTATGETWQIDSAGWAVRCPTPTTCARTTGHASMLLWSAGKVWAKSPTGAMHWWTWLNNPPTAAVQWQDSGTANDPVPDLSSPAGTRIPDALSFKDKAGAVWSLGGKAGDASRPVMKDGTQYMGGVGISLEWLDGNVYAFTVAGWYQATATGWVPLNADPNAAHNGVTVDFTITPANVPAAPVGQPS